MIEDKKGKPTRLTMLPLNCSQSSFIYPGTQIETVVGSAAGLATDVMISDPEIEAGTEPELERDPCLWLSAVVVLIGVAISNGAAEATAADAALVAVIKDSPLTPMGPPTSAVPIAQSNTSLAATTAREGRLPTTF